MKKAKNRLLLSTLGLLLTGCAGHDLPDAETTGIISTDGTTASYSEIFTESVETTEKKTTLADTEPSTEEEPPVASQHITWVLGLFGSPREEGQKQINRLLLEKGYDCEIHFMIPEKEDLDLGLLNADTIRPWLDAYESNNPPVDIMYTGAWNLDRFHGLDFVRENCIPLSDYLETEEGRPLKEFFSPYQWSHTSFGGIAYALPQMLYASYGSETSILHVADRYVQYFTDFDGSYASLKQIFEQYHQNEEVIEIDHDLRALRSFVGDESYLYAIPYNSQTRSFFDSKELRSYVDLIMEIYTDFQNGLLYYNGANGAAPPPRERVFAYIDQQDNETEGFTSIKLKGSFWGFNFAMTYGVSQKSENKELALKILTACYTDPEISGYLLPEMGGEDMINSRRIQTSSFRISEIENFAPTLTENQKEAITTFPCWNMFEDMFVYVYDEKKHSNNWVVNDAYDFEAICQEMEKPEYQDLIDELNKQLDAFFQTEEMQ